MFKTIKWNTGTAAKRFRLKNKKKKKINKAASSQAGGPSHKESGCKPSSLTGPGLWDILGLTKEK